MSATEVNAVHVHRDPPATVASRDRLGVILLIVADVAFVASMIFTYLYLRFLNVNGMWLPEEITPAPAGPTWVIVGIIVAGAVVIGLAVSSARKGAGVATTILAFVALLGALAALTLQFQQMVTFNFALAENGRYLSAYSSSMVALAAANLFHLVIAAFITLGLVIRSARHRLHEAAAWQPRLVMYWWVWIAVSAILVAVMTTFFVGSPFPPSMPGEVN